MSAPLEVVLVTRRYPKPFQRLAVFAFTAPLAALGDGWVLMFLLPLAHRVLTTPDVHAGYWNCVLFALTARWTVRSLLHRSPMPLATEAGAR